MKNSNIRAQVILSKEEYEALQLKADRLGLSFSAYARMLLRTTTLPKPDNYILSLTTESKGVS